LEGFLRYGLKNVVLKIQMILFIGKETYFKWTISLDLNKANFSLFKFKWNIFYRAIASFINQA
jgi:hypothetical protein